MEILIGAAVIIILLILMGVDIWYILVGGAALVALAAVFTSAFFTVCVVMLIRSKKCAGVFVEFGEGKRFDAAVYRIDDRDYRCIFPAEMVLRDKLYRPGKPVKLRLTRGGRVFDRNALLTSAIGLPMSLVIADVFAGGLLMLLGLGGGLGHLLGLI